MAARPLLVASTLLWTALANAAGPPSASGGSGTVFGTVTDDGTGAPLANVEVRVHADTGFFVGSDVTDGSGEWSVGGLEDGSYFASTFNSLDYIDEVYDDIPCVHFCVPTDGTPIPVTAGGTGGIDFALDFGGSITGTVSEEGTGTALPNVSVLIYDSIGVFVGQDVTDAAGDYSLGGLHAGTHFVQTLNLNDPHVDELYDDIPCPGISCVPTDGTPVTVTLSTPTSGIDFALAVGTTVSGAIAEDGSGMPLSGVFVDLYDATNAIVGTGFSGADGSYQVGGLIAGTYFAVTNNLAGYVDELYDDIPCLGSCSPSSGTPIAVPEPGTAGIDFELVLGGSVSGTVTDEVTAAPVVGVSIDLYDAGGTLVAGGSTDSAGSYTAGRLPTGTYFAVTRNFAGYGDELYDDFPCTGGCDPTAGTPLAVTAGSTTGGIDFELIPGAIFRDGFESGDLSAWSATVPLATP